MLRKAFIALLLAASALASVTITSSGQYQVVEKPQVATFTVQLNGSGVYSLSVDTPLRVSLSDNRVNLTNATVPVSLFLLSEFASPGLYLIKFKATDSALRATTYDLVLRINEGVPDLMFSALYSSIAVVQGEQTRLSFLVRNAASQQIRNILVRGDISGKFNPVYPEPFDLAPGESRSLDVAISVPQDYPTGRYSFTINAALGGLEHPATTELVVKQRAEVANVLSAELLLPWEPLKRGSETIGYKLFLRVKNKGAFAIENADVILQGFPPGWAFTGDIKFSIQPFDARDLTINIDPAGDFSEHTGDIVLVKEIEVITRVPLTLAGFKVGVSGSGLATLGGVGGSLTVGALLAVVIALVLLFIRFRNKHAPAAKQDDHIKSYLESLVQKAKAELEKERAQPAQPRPVAPVPVSKPLTAASPQGPAEDEVEEVEESTAVFTPPAEAEPGAEEFEEFVEEESPENGEEADEEAEGEGSELETLVKKAANTPRRRVVRRVVRRKVRGRK